MMWKKYVVWAIVALVALLLVIQIVPYGRNHTNPPVTQEVQWDSAQTQQLAQRACYDCHSNNTVWPWYSNVAPVSWLVQHDVDEGRSKLNFSEWDRTEQDEADEAGRLTNEGEMPPAQFLVTHPEARLTPAEKQALVDGLLTTFGGQLTGEREGEDRD